MIYFTCDKCLGTLSDEQRPFVLCSTCERELGEKEEMIKKNEGRGKSIVDEALMEKAERFQRDLDHVREVVYDYVTAEERVLNNEHDSGGAGLFFDQLSDIAEAFRREKRPDARPVVPQHSEQQGYVRHQLQNENGKLRKIIEGLREEVGRQESVIAEQKVVVDELREQLKHAPKKWELRDRHEEKTKKADRALVKKDAYDEHCSDFIDVTPERGPVTSHDEAQKAINKAMRQHPNAPGFKVDEMANDGAVWTHCIANSPVFSGGAE